MGPEQLPEDIAQAILDRIDSVPHLEALLLIQESSPRVLSGAEIASRIYVSNAAAERILQDLQRHALIRAVSGGYDVHPDPENVSLVTRLAATYRQHVAQVASLIHSRGPRALREFAKAFDMKGKDSKGGGHG